MTADGPMSEDDDAALARLALARRAEESLMALIDWHRPECRPPATLVLAHDYLAAYCESTGLAHAPRTETA